MIQILVMTPEPGASAVFRAACPDCEVHTAVTLSDAEDLARSCRFEYAFVDVAAMQAAKGDNDYKASVEGFWREVPGARLVIMSPLHEIREAVNFVRDGAADYLTYPIVVEEIQIVRDGIERRERIRSELRYLRERDLPVEGLGEVRSRAESMKAALQKVRQVASTRSTVLLTGETGTGKSYLAKVLHQNSTRAGRQFISIHCGAIPDTLLESELFGHERGAFTGADRRKLGKFEIANGGTLFLDEIATITPAMQVKLLNVLQERSFQRLGGEREVQVDVRILTATNVDLAKLAEEGSFRKDLFFRLNVFPIEVPPLRNRREDIPALVESFLERLRRFHQKEIEAVHPEVMNAFLRYPWPGNVRELENLLERAFILETSNILTPESFPGEVFGLGSAPSVQQISLAETGTLAEIRRHAVEDVEREYLRRQLDANGGRIDATARVAGITPRQLHKLMTKHGLKKEDFRTALRDGGERRSHS